MPENPQPKRWRDLEPHKRHLIIGIVIVALGLGLGLGFAPPHIQAVVNPVILLVGCFLGALKSVLVGLGYYRTGRRTAGVLFLVLALLLLLLFLATLDDFL